MTDEQKLQNLLQAAQDLDAAYARADAFDREHDSGEQLDAYGHLEWTVGNEDWLACFDAIRTHEGVAYHVVVDCESGGFTDTMDSGMIAIDDTNAIENLKCLPEYWAGVCWEHYYDQPDDMHPTDEEVADCAKRWAQHLDALVAEPAPEPDEEPSDEYAELRKAALNHRGEP